MRYLLLLGAAPAAWNDNQPTTDDGVFDDWALYTRALRDAGVLVGGHALHGVDMATTVRVRPEGRLLTDGPFVEAKEHLIGYYVIEAADLDGAISWAAKAPNARIGSVEIRPIVPGSASDEVLGQPVEP